ncbi:MAG TPA: M23 family metallopeptidase [Gemmatimonadaceae bacterium]|nr:M23 family metallopeptidase [Gemmatimonadaceae bacterium]
MLPVVGVAPNKLRDSFNEGRDGGRTHRATDILAPRGTPVVAAIDGEVVQIKQNSAGGLTIYLTDDEHRYIYYYAHLDRYSDQILQTARVRQGLLLGYVGTTGNAPPTHLTCTFRSCASIQASATGGTAHLLTCVRSSRQPEGSANERKRASRAQK